LTLNRESSNNWYEIADNCRSMQSKRGGKRDGIT
jgi:hypothetical protein